MSFLSGLSGDFLRRLAGGQANYDQPEDARYTNQVLGGAPTETFQQHAANALRGTDPNSYQNHITPGIGGTNPLGGLGRSMLGSIAGSLLGNVLGNQLGGGLTSTVGSLVGSYAGSAIANQGLGGFAESLGLTNTDPRQMNEQDVSRVASYAQQNNPDALARTAAEYRAQPAVTHALLGRDATMRTAGGTPPRPSAGKCRVSPSARMALCKASNRSQAASNAAGARAVDNRSRVGCASLFAAHSEHRFPHKSAQTYWTLPSYRNFFPADSPC